MPRPAYTDPHRRMFLQRSRAQHILQAHTFGSKQHKNCHQNRHHKGIRPLIHTVRAHCNPHRLNMSSHNRLRRSPGHKNHRQYLPILYGSRTSGLLCIGRGHCRWFSKSIATSHCCHNQLSTYLLSKRHKTHPQHYHCTRTHHLQCTFPKHGKSHSMCTRASNSSGTWMNHNDRTSSPSYLGHIDTFASLNFRDMSPYHYKMCWQGKAMRHRGKLLLRYCQCLHTAPHFLTDPHSMGTRMSNMSHCHY